MYGDSCGCAVGLDAGTGGLGGRGAKAGSGGRTITPSSSIQMPLGTLTMPKSSSSKWP